MSFSRHRWSTIRVGGIYQLCCYFMYRDQSIGFDAVLELHSHQKFLGDMIRKNELETLGNSCYYRIYRKNERQGKTTRILLRDND